MKHLKLYEHFDENDPFGEEIEYVKPTFLSWLKKNYPDENKWNRIKEINCSDSHLTSLEGIKLKNLVKLKALNCSRNQFSIEYKNYLRNHCKKKNIYLDI